MFSPPLLAIPFLALLCEGKNRQNPSHEALQNHTGNLGGAVRLIERRSYHSVIAVWRPKEAQSHRVNYWNIIADTLDSLNKARLWNSRNLSAPDKDAH
jgi:hypothetical protein